MAATMIAIRFSSIPLTGTRRRWPAPHRRRRSGCRDARSCGDDRPLSARMKQHRSDQVGQCDPRAGSRSPAVLLVGDCGSVLAWLLNISSIRSVTTKPPTRLIAASTTATMARRDLAVVVRGTGHHDRADQHDAVDRVRADISGVCRIAETFAITSKPTKTLRTKIVSSAMAVHLASLLLGGRGVAASCGAPRRGARVAGCRWLRRDVQAQGLARGGVAHRRRAWTTAHPATISSSTSSATIALGGDQASSTATTFAE